jgi:hypothetical protein
MIPVTFKNQLYRNKPEHARFRATFNGANNHLDYLENYWMKMWSGTGLNSGEKRLQRCLGSISTK